MSKSKGLSTIIIILITVVLMTISAIGGYYYGTNTTATTTSLITTARTTPSKITTTSAVGATTTAVDETANWKTYTNNQYGFSFKYPDNITINNITKGDTSLDINISKISDLDAPLGFDKENAIQDKNAIAKGDPSTAFAYGIKNSYQVVDIPNALAKKFTVLQQLEVCDVRFTKTTLIYKDDYQISLSLSYKKDTIVANSSDYFKTDQTNCGSIKIWKNAQSFYDDLTAGKTDQVSQTWSKNFDQILSTFKFTP